MTARSSPWAFALIAAGTVLGLAGTDLVLPAVPALPRALGGSPALAQLVLAAFVAGAGAGLLLFGELGARFDQRRLLILSLAAYASVSWAAGRSESLELLVALRFFQGAAGSAAAVFAPGMLRALYDEPRAVRAIGRLASIESLVPALAPVAGAWIVAVAGWRATFDAVALLSLLLAVTLALLIRRLPEIAPVAASGGFARLFRDPVFLRYSLSHAFTLGGLLSFVFGAPAVITRSMGGSIFDFVGMQLTGIAFFIAGATLAGRLTERIGPERMIYAGTALSAAGALAILGYAAGGEASFHVLWALFVPMNLGLGLRGPPGFHRAVIAAAGDDARGAALVILFILLAAAGGTALAAPFISEGLVAIAAVGAALSSAAMLCLLLLPPLAQR